MSAELEKIAKQVKELEEKKRKLEARQKEILNKQKAKDKAEERKRDTRRKIIIGGAVLSLFQKKETISKKELWEHIQQTLPPKDQILFKP